MQGKSCVRGFVRPPRRNGRSVQLQLEIAHLGALKLKLELVRNQGDEFRIGGLALGVAHRVAEEPLEGVQIAPVPGDLDGVADGSFHPAGGGLEGLCHLGIEDFRDGIRAPDGPRRGFQGLPKSECDRQQLIAFFIALFATAPQGLTI